MLGRDPWGAPLANPPLLEALAFDPILGKCKLIAEAWDAGGLYQVGSFPAYGRWAEWNGKYRDTVRRFLKGDRRRNRGHEPGDPGLARRCISGRGPTASINFVTCHDGFNLADLVSYNDKHNEANGEDNSDGANDNDSWNCGWEGPTDDPAILALRRRQMKNAMAMLLVSQGVPMILMGDEVGQSKLGNNNTYCLDTEINWLDWSLRDRNTEHFRFVKNMIAFRRAHPVLRNPEFFRYDDTGGGYCDISWHGTRAWQPDWGGRVLAFMLSGRHGEAGAAKDDFIYVAMNMYWEALPFELPRLPDGIRWRVFANTGMPSPEDIFEPGKEPELTEPAGCIVGGRSVVILVGRPAGQ